MMTSSGAPVMLAAARMMCSRSIRIAMVELCLDLPNFHRRKHAGEGRVLTQPLGVFPLGAKQIADLVNRPPKNDLPLGITAQQ